MADGTSLINIGELSKPATVLIEKVCSAVGIVFEPTRIVRKANAEAKAEIIKAKANIEIRDIEQRAIDRFIQQETRKQENIESITFQAAKNLPPDAKVESLDEDWIAYFFKHCETVSDQEMQSLWSKLLAGEASNPGTFSRRTVQFISTIEKEDAELFTTFCQFVWVFSEPMPIILDRSLEIYTKHGVSFDSLIHLQSIGLLTFESLSKYRMTSLSKNLHLRYHDRNIKIIFNNDKDNDFAIGQATFTAIGKELFYVAGAEKNQDFYDFITSEWKKPECDFKFVEL